jgi:hypothetical protein
VFNPVLLPHGELTACGSNAMLPLGELAAVIASRVNPVSLLLWVSLLGFFCFVSSVPGVSLC